MNWYLAGGWFLVCVLIGGGLYRQAWNKVQDCKAWLAFFDYLEQAIGFALQPLPQIVASHLSVCQGNCQVVLKDYLTMLTQKHDLTRESCRRLVADQALAEFLYQLGRTGRETEQDKIKAIRHLFVEKKEQAQQNLQGKASIMLKLLIIIGIAGGILWI